ncbi:MAG: CusA/CzcA family heavy metal efflux RND transporter [bacterium]|nr:CusA/CzcA family heavy metal efflux RND transporter [bacterium]
MHTKLVDISLKYRFITVIGLMAIIGVGIYEYLNLPVAAFPDISPVMVPVFVEAHGMAPEEVERLITFPVESAMNGLPGVSLIKSTSGGGLAVIYVYFNDNVDMYFARQIVAERLNQAAADLPTLHEPPKLGPITTGLGQIFLYYLTLDPGTDTEGKDPDTYLREVNDWIVKYQLQTVRGVTDILSMGGNVLQYQIVINPRALSKFNLRLDEIVDAVNNNNKNAGGQFIVVGSEEYNVRGVGLLRSLDDIRDIHVKSVNGMPIRIADVADVKYGKEMRRGVVSRNGEQEVVSGIVLQLYGQNTSKVIKDLYAKLPDVERSLPPGVKLVPYYEQAELVTKANGTVTTALWQGGLLVIAVLAIFLGNFRSSFVVSLALPFCALFAVICMRLAGISANLMSLGGIAISIGMLGDGTTIMVENIFRHLNNNEANKDRDIYDVILAGAREMVRPMFFSIIIILLVFAPIFTLQGVEGKMFKPMAFTLVFAILGSLVVALASPALCTYLLKPGAQKELALLRVLKAVYHVLLRIVIKGRVAVLLAVLVALGLSFLIYARLGTEFIPALEEGSIFISVNMAPSIALGKAVETIQTLERKIMKYEEVDEVISRIGRPEAGSHPHPVNYGEIHIELKPMTGWKRFKDKKGLVDALNAELKPYPGVQLNFTQPIQNAFGELLSGSKAQLAIKVFGDDLDVLSAKAGEIRNAIDKVPGLVDLSAEQSFGQPQIQVVADRAACARYGVDVADVLELVELAIGGEAIDQMYLNTRRFGIHVRYEESYRATPEAMKNLLVHTDSGAQVPLKQVAKIEQVLGPIQINRENNQRRWTVFGNVRGRDLGSVVADIRKIVAEKVTLPTGYYVAYGGQFENQQRAMRRLSIIVPLVGVLVFCMLWLSFASFRSALLIFVNVPLALIGGIAGLWLWGEYLSVPAAIGFIALFGIAVQNGMVLVSCINEFRAEGMPTHDAIIQGCLQRLRPVLMTALTTIIGLVPLLLARGIGSEVQRPLAVVVAFGLASATALTLLVIPAFYSWFMGKENRMPQ